MNELIFALLQHKTSPREKKRDNTRFISFLLYKSFVGSIYGRSSIKMANFVPIRQQTWLPQAILVSDWLIHIKIFSETSWPDELKFGRRHPWKFLYNDCSFNFNPLTNMVTTENSCFCLVVQNKIFSSETDQPNEPKLGRNKDLYSKKDMNLGRFNIDCM